MRSKQTARKAAPSSIPSSLTASLRMRASSGMKEVAIPSTITRAGAAPKAKASAPTAANSTVSLAAVDHTHSTPYDRPGTTRTVYDSQELANEAVLEHWDEYKVGYSLEECRLYSNKAGYRKFFMRDEEGTEDTYEAKPHAEGLEWELEEDGASASERS